MALTYLVEVPGTDWNTQHDGGNMQTIDDELYSLGVEAAAATTKTAMLTRETAIAGGKIELLESTGGGSSKVIIQAPATLGGNRTITIPDADVDLTEVPLNTAFRIANAPNLLTDRGLIAAGAAVPVNVSGQYQIATAAAETNTMAIPATTGLLVSLYCTVHAVGDRVITVDSAINQAGNTVMTFGAVGDWIMLQSITTTGGTLAWRVVSNDGVALS